MLNNCFLLRFLKYGEKEKFSDSFDTIFTDGSLFVL